MLVWREGRRAASERAAMATWEVGTECLIATSRLGCRPAVPCQAPVTSADAAVPPSLSRNPSTLPTSPLGWLVKSSTPATEGATRVSTFLAFRPADRILLASSRVAQSAATVVQRAPLPETVWKYFCFWLQSSSHHSADGQFFILVVVMSSISPSIFIFPFLRLPPVFSASFEMPYFNL